MHRHSSYYVTPLLIMLAALLGLPSAAASQSPRPAAEAANPATASGAEPAGDPAAETDAETAITPPPGYVIGPDDVLGVVFWRDPEMSGDVTVRPDGMVSLPLIQDIKAAGLTPDELREDIQAAAGEYIQDPSVTVAVRQINSRTVFINGEVSSPGAYPLTGPMTIVQLIAVAGGLSEWANSKNIRVMRADGEVLTFNYRDVSQGKNLEQNIRLAPGDTVMVP